VPPLLPRSKKLRTALLVAGSLVFVAIVVAVLVSLGDSGAKHTPSLGKAKKPSGTTAKTKNPETLLVMGRVVVQNTGFPTAVKAPVRRVVMSATQRYFDDAIQAPLLHGKVDNAFATVFDAGVSGAARHGDRETLTDAATGPIRGPVRMGASKVRIDGLGDPSGKLVLVATTFTLDVNATTPTGKLTISRHTELTFAYESGHWLVTAYHVSVQRSIGKKTTSTTARAGKATTT
jgi:hypothetical protein